MPLPLFARWVSDLSGYSVIMDETLRGRTVTLEVVDQPVDEVLSAVARSLGVALDRRRERLFYLGTFQESDAGVLVRRVRRLDQEQLTSAIAVLSSRDGNSISFAGGLVIVSDRVEVLDRIDAMLDEVESSVRPVWVVQLYVVSLSDHDLADFGFNFSPALDVALAYAAGSAVGAAGVSVDAGLAAVLTAAETRDSMSLMAEPLFYLSDGESATFVRGQAIPLPLRSVSNMGTVSTNSYKRIQTGQTIDVTIRESSADTAFLTVSVESSDIRGYVERAPIIFRENFSTRGEVRSGGVYLLGSHRLRNIKTDRRWWLRWGLKNEVESKVLQIWCRACLVSHPTVSQVARLPMISTSGRGEAAARDEPRFAPHDVEVAP